MKVEELTVGDWVYDGNSIAQVTGITCDGIIETTHNQSSNIEIIWPIPLSAEILEKNGFTKKLDADRLHYWFILIDGHTKFSILYARSVFQWLGPLDFKYVHELQHALKLCGIEKEIVL